MTTAAAATAGEATTGGAIAAAEPAGFDVLLGPQSAMMDVYYGGRRMGSVMAQYRPGLIRFATPAAVVAMIPRLKHAPAVRRALDEDLPTHADRACDNPADDRCGHLSTDLVGVIFDEARFRVELFVNPAYLDVDTPLVSRYLPPSEAGVSMAANLGGVVSGSDRTGATYSVQGRAILAFNNAHIETEISQSSTVGLQVQSVAATLDKGPLRYQGGLLWTPGQDLIGQGQFYGVSLQTQTDTLMNRDQIIASPILLYLSNKAQVDILRAGRLVASRQYDAGNQLIDTSSLPDGAYPITLRIREAGGYTHEEVRAFNKNRSMPPLGFPQFFLGGGVVAQSFGSGLPRGGGLLLEGGYARRFSPSTAIDLTAALVGRRGLFEAGATYFPASALRLRLATIASSDGDFGFLLSTALTWSTSSLSLDARQGWGGRSIQSPVNTTTADLAATYQQNAFGLGLSGSQFSARYSVAWRGGQYGFVAGYNTSPFSKSSHTYGPTVDLPVRIAGHDLRFIGNLSQTEHGTQAFFGIRLQFGGGRRSVYGQTGFTSTSDGAGHRDTGPSISLTGAINNVDPRLGDETLAASFDHTQDRSTASLNGQVRGDHGDLTGEIDRDISGPSMETRFSAGFQVGVAVTLAHAALGSPSGGQSGVIVDVKGAPAGTQFEVMINDAPRATISAGQSAPIMLPAYHVYSVRLAPKGGAALDFDTTSRKVSLYPGNVVPLLWKAERVVEVFGRIVDENGQAVAQAAIGGARYPSLSDNNGYFQVELSSAGALIVQRPGGGVCRVDVSALPDGKGHISLGTRKCYSQMIASNQGGATATSAARMDSHK